MSLDFVGPDLATDYDLAYREYVESRKSEDLSTGTIDSMISSGLAAYADKSYVDTQDALLSTQAYIDSQDLLRIALASKDVPNGVASLDSTGRIPVARINAPNDQIYYRGPWSPTSYNSAVDVTTETTLYSCPVTDPGFTYKLAVTGQIDAHTNLDTEYPFVQVRVGNASSGEVIATGRGTMDALETGLAGDDFNRGDSNDVGGGWSQTHIEGSSSSKVGTEASEAILQTTGDNAYRLRRVDPSTAVTGTDLQRVVATIGSDAGTNTSDPYTRLYMRMNAAGTSYCVFEIKGNGATRFYYSTGGSEVPLGSTTSMSRPTNGVVLTAVAGTPAAPRSFFLYRNGSLILQVDDSASATAMGSGNRGWGFGLKSAAGFFFTTERPPTIDSISIGENATNLVPLIIIPELSTMTPLTGSTTLYVRGVRSGASSTQSFSTFKPKLHVMAFTA